MVTLVVFSMDRAMQLDSLLRSIVDNVTGVQQVVVIYKATSPLHERAYDMLLDADEELPFELHTIEETSDVGASGFLGDATDGAFNMRDDNELSPPDHIGLAVDDMIFYRPSDFALAAKILDFRQGFTWSWRLGHREPARVDFHMDGALNSMWWSCTPLTEDPDYRYLFHTDGALYRRNDFTGLLNQALTPTWRQKSYIPNELESACAKVIQFTRGTRGPHLGPIAPTCITWQINKESTTKGRFGAPWCEIPATNLDAMAEAFLAGRRVDNVKLYTDTRWTMKFNPPGARSTHVHACEAASRFYASLIR